MPNLCLNFRRAKNTNMNDIVLDPFQKKKRICYALSYFQESHVFLHD